MVYSAPHSIYENTFKVLPSQVISFDGVSVKRNTYYKIKRQKINKNISYATCKKELHSILESSIKKMLIADVEIGCFSGGIDSSLVALLMQKNTKKELKHLMLDLMRVNMTNQVLLNWLQKRLKSAS